MTSQNNVRHKRELLGQKKKLRELTSMPKPLLCNDGNSLQIVILQAVQNKNRCSSNLDIQDNFATVIL